MRGSPEGPNGLPQHMSNSTFNSTDNSEFLGTEESNIQLSSNNYVKGYLGNRESLLILVDSGASSSIISRSCIQGSACLSQSRLFSIEPRRFRIGNGEFLTCLQAISFEVSIQNHKFLIQACIADNLTGPDLLMGASTLAALNGSLDFRTHSFTVRPKKVWFTPVNGQIIKPGQSRHVVLKAKLPKVLKQSELVLQSCSFLRKHCPSSMLVKLKKGSCTIQVTNSGKKPITLSSNRPVAFTDLSDISHAIQQVPQDVVHAHITRDTCDSDVHYQNLKKYPHLSRSDPVSKKTAWEILRGSIDLDSDACILKPESKNKVWDMLLKHKEAFSLYGEIGHCSDIEVDIRLKDATPFNIRPYPMADELKPIMDKELQKLVKLGILKRGCSAYSSPCLLIKKPHSNDYRFVSDFRYLNTKVITAQQNYLSLQNVLAKLGKSQSRVVSVIDLKSAFHTLPLSRRSQQYTGICPYPGSPMYMYQRLPMGMNLSPACWQQRINEIMSTIPNKDDFCITIHDDCLLFSRSEAEHMQHIEQVLETFEKYGLKLSPQKCRLFRRQCTYIGHEISISDSDGVIRVKAMTDKCDAIRKMRKPTNCKEVRRFIGAVTFLSMYLPKLQVLLRPLHSITRKNQRFTWTEEHDDCYEKIRQLLVSPPVLCAPQGPGDFHLYSDTSRQCTGSVLMQDIQGQQRVVGYYSKILPNAAQRYSVSELELTGLFLNITAWKYYLQSTNFHAYVDHSSLVQMFNSKHQLPTIRLQKLMERLAPYSFDISYCKGSDMVISDFLSRAPREDDDELERILPVALPAQLEEMIQPHAFPYQAAPVERPVTRAYAREKSVPIKPLFPEKKQTTIKIVDTTDHTQSDRPNPVLADSVSDVPPTVHDNEPEQPVLQRSPSPSNKLRLVPGNVETITRPRLRRPPPEETRLVDNVLQKSTSVDEESEEPCPEFLRKPTPLIDKVDTVTAQHIPNQAELNRILKIIKKKVIRDYNLPFDALDFKAAQHASPHFKPIYDYLAHNILPSDKKAARVIMLRAEQYLLCNDILFRLFLHPNSDQFSLQLVVPDQFIDSLIAQYHDSVLSNHQGCVRTYLTMRKLFYFHSMYQRIVLYIQSCARCQEFKGKTDNLRPFHERIPLSYSPFQTISLDFKKMSTSKAGYSWLMVITCAITRYTVCVPLKTLDAPTISEALIQRVFCCFGIPDVLVTDAQSSLVGKVMEIVCEALKISQKVISVMNHGSLHVERQIKSIADLIKVNLDQYGENWVQYHSVAQYSFNTFSSPQLGNYSPYYLVFYREPKDVSGLNFRPLVGLTSSQAEYIEQVKERFESVSKFMLQLQKNHQQTQNEKISQRLAKSPTYHKGQLVYLHKPSSSSLTSDAKKFMAKYVGPFAIHQVLDSTHVLLVDLKGRILRDVFHINRLKPAFMRATEGKNISNLQKLREALGKQDEKSDSKESDCHVASDDHFQFIDENGFEMNCTDDDFVFSAQTDPVDLRNHQQNLAVNNGLAAPEPLSHEIQIRLLNRLQQAPLDQASYLVDRAKFQAGQLRLLLSVSLKDSIFKFWWDPQSYRSCGQIVEKVLSDNSKVRCLGSPLKFAKRVLGY